MRLRENIVICKHILPCGLCGLSGKECDGYITEIEKATTRAYWRGFNEGREREMEKGENTKNENY